MQSASGQTQESNMVFYRKAAEAIFANSPEKKDTYAKDPELYARSVEQKLWELKQQYREFNLALGPIGAGLPPEEIKEGTELHDLVARLSVDFPHWKRLHSIWRMLPDVNPYAPSVEPPTMESVEGDTLMLIIMELECKRWEAETTKLLAQRAKYDSRTARANADLELEKLKHQERLLQMEHQREREKEAHERAKEAHQLRMLELQLTLHRSENTAYGAGPSIPLQSPLRTVP